MARVVEKMPLTSLWNASGPVTAERVGLVGANQVRSLLQAGPLHFVVARIGEPLDWITLARRFDFWKSEARDRIDNGPFYFGDQPGAYVYRAWQWRMPPSLPIIVLERAD